MGKSGVSVEQQPYSEASFQIPFDLFVSKKGFGSGSYIRFTDCFGNLVFKVERPPKSKHKPSASSHPVKLLLDASGSVLISIHKVKNGSWRGFRIYDSREEQIFRVEETLSKLTRTEFDIFLIGQNGQDSDCTDFKMRGCPFKRSCTVYKGDSILAESSLMYKLGIQKAFVPRSRFRVTLLPGFGDHGLVVALVVIFFDGRKLWV